jgi:hypothetical protein
VVKKREKNNSMIKEPVYKISKEKDLIKVSVIISPQQKRILISNKDIYRIIHIEYPAIDLDSLEEVKTATLGSHRSAQTMFEWIFRIKKKSMLEKIFGK